MSASSLQLRLAHATIPARETERMVAFYTEVLGFHVTDRGEPVPGMGEMVFLSQTPDEHHQIVLVHTPEPAPRSFMMADHLAFRTGSLDDLRALADRLVADGNTSGIPISHGNAWSVYFTDPEGNGLEVFVDTPFHVVQPYADGLDLSASDDDIESTTRGKVEPLPGHRPFDSGVTRWPPASRHRADVVDLGIAGRTGIVCASSRGLGFACADALAREGVHVTINSRDADALGAAADRLAAAHDVRVTAVVGDIADPATQQTLIAACPTPDILVNNNGGPTPGRFADWDRDTWIAALDANMLAPLAMIRAVLDGMVERRFGRIVNITSAMVKTPLSPMGLSTGARTGLTSVAKALSKDVARANVTINNLLPERIDTERQRQMAELHASMANISVEEAYALMAKSIAAGRLGRPDELGDACAYLCSAQAGYISGQSIQVDGGSFAGLM